MSHKYVYLFTEGNGSMRELLGGKGANLAEMTNIGLPVPQGFTISTEACTKYYEDGRMINEDIQAQIMDHVAKLEEITGKKFGDKENPLLVSVRSGARASMPGMMDTILNLGLNEDVVNVLATKSGNPRWAWDCYRRFIQMYSDVVMEVGKKYFEALIDEMKAKKGVKQDVELTAEDLKELAAQFKAEYKNKIGKDFPSDPKEQLMGAVEAVFRSWDNPRANVYRRDNDIPYSWGTAVNVQMMAFGNMGDNCGTGVAFTRDPATGEPGLMGEFLTNAQGEDVVAGVRTPMPIAEMAEKFPAAFKQFQEVCAILEDHYRDMQDMEFTVDAGCGALERVVMPVHLSLLGEGAFVSCTALSSIDMKDCDIAELSAWTFASCTHLQQVLLPITISRVAEGAFYYCTSLQQIELPEGIATLDAFAFAGCSALQHISFIPEGVESIERYAFYRNISASKAHIPTTVSYIGDHAFDGCINAMDFVTYREMPAELGEEVFANMEIEKKTLGVETESVVIYSSTAQWQDFGTINGITAVEDVTVCTDITTYFDAYNLIVTAPQEIVEMRLFDTSGILLAYVEPGDCDATIDTHAFTTNLYLVQVVMADGRRVVAKVARIIR